MKIGVQTYTLRDHLKTLDEIDATFKRIKAIGFNMIQLSGLGVVDFDWLSDKQKELGIEICGTHSPWETMAEPEELKKLIAGHKKLGSPDIGLGMKPSIYPNTYEGFTSFIKKINEICKIVKDNGLTFGYHNHELEFEKFDGVKAIDRMAEECPDLTFVLDVFWVQAGGENPIAYIDKFKDRIKIMHFKDFRIKDSKRQFAEIGQGNLNWKEIIPRCKNYNIPYAVIEQDGDFLTNPFESIILSKNYLVQNGYLEN